MCILLGNGARKIFSYQSVYDAMAFEVKKMHLRDVEEEHQRGEISYKEFVGK